MGTVNVVDVYVCGLVIVEVRVVVEPTLVVYVVTEVPVDVVRVEVTVTVVAVGTLVVYVVKRV